MSTPTDAPGSASEMAIMQILKAGATLMTWERFMGGTRGFNNAPNKKFSFVTGMRGSGGELTPLGLSNFCFVGIWASMAPALFGNALSGRRAIQALCKKDGKKLRVVRFSFTGHPFSIRMSG